MRLFDPVLRDKQGRNALHYALASESGAIISYVLEFCPEQAQQHLPDSPSIGTSLLLSPAKRGYSFRLSRCVKAVELVASLAGRMQAVMLTFELQDIVWSLLFLRTWSRGFRSEDPQMYE